MKTKLLKKLRAKAAEKFIVVKVESLSTTEYKVYAREYDFLADELYHYTKGIFVSREEAISKCSELRYEYILEEIRERRRLPYLGKRIY